MYHCFLPKIFSLKRVAGENSFFFFGLLIDRYHGAESTPWTTFAFPLQEGRSHKGARFFL